MSDQENNTPPETNGAAGGAADQAAAGQSPVQLQVLGQYIRDLSFENPNAPATLGQQNQQGQEVNVSVDVQARRVQDNDYECMLQVHAAVTKDNKPHFIVELAYCGLFRLGNAPEESHHPIMLIEAPRILFPFARRIISDMSSDGGYMPLLLDPIDFALLYRQQMAQQAQQNPGGATPNAPGGTA